MFDKSFIKNILAKCQSNPGRLVLPEGNDLRTRNAVKILVERRAFSDIYLIGSPETETKSLLGETSGISTRVHLLSSHKDEVGGTCLSELTTACCVSMLESKGRKPNLTALEPLISHPLYQAGALIALDHADCAVAGALSTTADVIRACLATVGLRPGCRTVSGGFFMDRQLPNDPLSSETIFFADCGVVIEPTIDQLVDIAFESSKTWQMVMNSPPVVAFLSFSTKGSAEHESAEKIRSAHRTFQSRCPEIISDGELQFDAAYVESVGLRKAPNSPVPGRANVFVFPDLNSGNIAYKIAQRLGGFGAYGPILQGLHKPYSDLSRGASAEDIATSALINRVRSIRTSAGR
jgi:phosphate acetyltransferase